MLDDLRKQYGEIFKLKLGSLGSESDWSHVANGEWVFLTRPDHIRDMFHTHSKHVTAATANQIFFDTTEQSIAYIDGETHTARQVQLQRLLNGARDYTFIAREETLRAAPTWVSQTSTPLFPRLQDLTSRIITRIICGGLPQNEQQFIYEILPRLEDRNRSREETIQVDKALRARIANLIAKIGHLPPDHTYGDVLHELLQEGVQQEDGPTTADVVRDEIFSLLYTGFSTTATTLSWVLLHLMGEPNIYRHLVAELSQLFGQETLGRPDIQALPYCDAVIRETLRLHPVTALNGVRLTREDLEIGDHLISSGTVLVNCSYLLHRSPDLYPDPELFSPERFVQRRPDSATWTPFGGGRHSCVGQQFAMREMKMILATLLENQTFASMEPIPPAQLQTFFMAPANGCLSIVAQKSVVGGSREPTTTHPQ